MLNIFSGILSFIIIFFSTGFMAFLFSNKVENKLEYVFYHFILFIIEIILIGYVASLINKFGKINYWLLLSLLNIIFIAAILLIIRKQINDSFNSLKYLINIIFKKIIRYKTLLLKLNTDVIKKYLKIKYFILFAITFISIFIVSSYLKIKNGEMGKNVTIQIELNNYDKLNNFKFYRISHNGKLNIIQERFTGLWELKNKYYNKLLMEINNEEDLKFLNNIIVYVGYKEFIIPYEKIYKDIIKIDNKNYYNLSQSIIEKKSNFPLFKTIYNWKGDYELIINGLLYSLLWSCILLVIIYILLQKDVIIDKILNLLLFSSIICLIFNLIIVLFSNPNHYDSMAYHLARVAYYLQHNNLNYFNANYWAQVIHPKISSILQSYIFLVFNNEKMFQIIQYVSFLISIISIYGITKLLTKNKKVSIISALIFSLLVECLFQATTTQNDILITTFAGCIVYFFLAFLNKNKTKYLIFISICFSILLGIKASGLLLAPSFILLGIYIFIITFKFKIFKLLRSALILILSMGFFILIITIPSGYYQNYKLFDNPVGPKEIREIHSFENLNKREIISEGIKNIFRYNIDFMSFDGFPDLKIINNFQKIIKQIIQYVFVNLKIDLVNQSYSRAPFSFKLTPSSNADYSYWGVFGFLLLLPLSLLVLFNIVKATLRFKIFSICSILFFISQSFAGPYDPWRGRYFIQMAVFSIPIVSVVFMNKNLNNFFKNYLIILILIGCFSGLSAVINHNLKNSNITKTRNKAYAFMYLSGTIEKFESNVNRNSKIIVEFPGNMWEYPLFGENLSRKLFPIGSIEQKKEDKQVNYDYLIYIRNFDFFDNKDLLLGYTRIGKLYLRKL